MNVKSFFLGYTEASSPAENAEAIINLCNASALHFSAVKIDGNRLSFCVPLFCEKRLKRLASENGIEITIISRHGLPALFYRYKMRLGILAGLVASLVTYFFSAGLVWDIRIDGAKSVSESQLLQVFSECGLTVGSKISDIDADVLENQILILSDDISWVSVNMSNNVANVEIRELDYKSPDEYGDALYSNVVASQDGIIVGFEDVNGSISVDIGDAVCRDQLLISGILGEEGSPTRLTNAHGRVFAEVEEVIEIKIPRTYTKKVTKNTLNIEKSLIFFKNEIKFFSNSGNLPTIYDKIDIVENFYTFNGKRLPLALKTVKLIEYEEQEISRSKLEMLSLAYASLYRRIDSYYADAEILSRTVSIDEQDDQTILLCKLRCIKNIGQIKEIIVS